LTECLIGDDTAVYITKAVFRCLLIIYKDFAGKLTHISLSQRSRSEIFGAGVEYHGASANLTGNETSLADKFVRFCSCYRILLDKL
tara:strand:+ start:1560 stop:1817 length:258 start_codon:yes stop_codon:yes gene_type:complete